MTIFRSSALLGALLAGLAAQPACAQTATDIVAIIGTEQPDANQQLAALIAPLLGDRARLDSLLAEAGFVRSRASRDCDFFINTGVQGTSGHRMTASITVCPTGRPIVLIGRSLPATMQAPSAGQGTSVPKPNLD